jgi:dTDP-4-dehydrorhamnose reductase
MIKNNIQNRFQRLNKIVITGAEGFLGKYLVNYLTERRWGVVPLNRAIVDLTDESKLKEVFNKINPSIVVHTAGIAVNEPNIELFEKNLKIITNIIKTLPNKCHLINTSSIVVYGDYPNRCDENTPTVPTSLYGASKLAIESLIEAYSKLETIKGCNLRLTAIVGPNPTHGLLKAFFEKINNLEPILNGIGITPGSIKPFTYIEDVAKAINMAIQNGLQGTYNVGPDDEISCLEVANIMMEEMNKFKDIRFSGPSFVGDNNKLHISSAKIKKLGWWPTYRSSSEAVRRATQDLIKNATK